MKLQEALRVQRGVTAVVGSGGKTTLLRELSRELIGDGSAVVLATSTRILPFDDVATVSGTDEEAVAASLAKHGVACVGEPAEKGKLAAPAMGFGRLAALADYVLVEADGSKRLPLKAHAAWEPVVPQEAKRAILVVGASGFGGRVASAVHRPELFCELAGCAQADAATPELIARIIAAEALADTVVVNQAETPGALAAASRLAARLTEPVFAGSLRGHELQRA
ncbi:selenium cofactor biosynthesis protein YqeC [Paratractidigestivibacter sp.]|uniref:selenium cofactor biosynthesis protein YqeC n=1 Tax=Paratractidigestivibacter sp. TaxID=2847316 RepID=UPI002AC92EC9|nr:selenium cofactor biosynthesis protein YqeC [Paratractidigestivibacter sp.]